MPEPSRRFRHVIDSPAGPLTFGSFEGTLTHVLFGECELPNSTERKSPVIGEAVQQVREYFRGRRRSFELEIAPSARVFQSRVLRALSNVRFATLTTYGDIARTIDAPRAWQAVGKAVGANPIGIIIPCHRVLPASGLLGGFAGGSDAKKALLHVEGFQVDSSGRVVRA